MKNSPLSSLWYMNCFFWISTFSASRYARAASTLNGWRNTASLCVKLEGGTTCHWTKGSEGKKFSLMIHHHISVFDQINMILNMFWWAAIKAYLDRSIVCCKLQLPVCERADPIVHLRLTGVHGHSVVNEYHSECLNSDISGSHWVGQSRFIKI